MWFILTDFSNNYFYRWRNVLFLYRFLQEYKINANENKNQTNRPGAGNS